MPQVVGAAKPKLLAQLVPISPDLANNEAVDITPAVVKEGQFILGRGKLTGIQDVHVSRKQVYAEYHASKTEPYLTITVEGGKSSYIYRNDDELETTEVQPKKQEVLHNGDVLYLLRDRFGYQFKVEGATRKKKGAADSDQDLQKQKTANKQVTTLQAQLKQVQAKLVRAQKGEKEAKAQVEQLKKRVQELKNAEAREKKRYNDLQAQYDSLLNKGGVSPARKPLKRGRPSNTPTTPSKRQKKNVESEPENDDVATFFNENSSDESDDQFEESSDEDVLDSTQLSKLDADKVEDSWLDRMGQTCQWIGPEHSDGLNRFYSGILIGKRLFSIGDTVLVHGAKHGSVCIGLIISLYQTPLNKRRVQLQWFYYTSEVMNASTKMSPSSFKQSCHSKKEIFASVLSDSNDVGVLEKHCTVKKTSTDDPNFATIALWAKAGSNRYYWRNYYDTDNDSLTPNQPVRQKV